MNYAHGGDIYSRDIDLDFSANLNPLGIPEAVRKAAAAADFTRYPDPRCCELRRAICEYENVPRERIVCGNGAADLIYRIVNAVRPKRALLCSPTFSEYEKALAERGCEVLLHPLLEENGFTLGEDFLPKITPDIEMVFLCTPNNPAGNTIEPLLLEKILRKCCDTGTLAVVDECFLDFAEDGEKFSAKRYLNERVIVLKAFTKICAMAGLRLGYAIFGDDTLAEAVFGSGQPWSVSSPAQAAGIAAAELLSKTDFLTRTRLLVAQERKYLAEELAKRGIKVFPSQANFLLLKSEKNLAEILAKRKIAIRSCADYHGLGEEFFRTAVRTHEENKRLIEAIE